MHAKARRDFSQGTNRASARAHTHSRARTCPAPRLSLPPSPSPHTHTETGKHSHTTLRTWPVTALLLVPRVRVSMHKITVQHSIAICTTEGAATQDYSLVRFHHANLVLAPRERNIEVTTISHKMVKRNGFGQSIFLLGRNSKEARFALYTGQNCKPKGNSFVTGCNY